MKVNNALKNLFFCFVVLGLTGCNGLSKARLGGKLQGLAVAAPLQVHQTEVPQTEPDPSTICSLTNCFWQGSNFMSNAYGCLTNCFWRSSSFTMDVYLNTAESRLARYIISIIVDTGIDILGLFPAHIPTIVYCCGQLLYPPSRVLVKKGITWIRRCAISSIPPIDFSSIYNNSCGCFWRVSNGPTMIDLV